MSTRMATNLSDFGENRVHVRNKRARRQPKVALPLYKALVHDTAQASMKVFSSVADIDDAIIGRMKKILERANHSGTSEPEAKAALYMASRLMKQYNVTQAEVLSHETQEEQRKYAGQSTVLIIHHRDVGSPRAVRLNGYVERLMSAIDKFFETKSFTDSSRTSLAVVFYGIAENTSAAAYAFEMVYNLVVEWAQDPRYKGISGKHSYCLGVCDELYKVARKERKDEDVRAGDAEAEAVAGMVRQEETQRESELGRLRGLLAQDDSKLNTQVVSDDHDGDMDMTQYAFSQEVEHITSVPQFQRDANHPIRQRRRGDSVASPDVEYRAQSNDDHKWASHMQLIMFRKKAFEIADNYLQDSGMKLYSTSRSRPEAINKVAYKQGRKDGRKIDVRRKTIKADKDGYVSG